MNFITCRLEKYPSNTKKKYSGKMCSWIKENEYIQTFTFKQKAEIVGVDRFNHDISKYQEYLKDKIDRQNRYSHLKYDIVDRQLIKEFKISDYGCQFITLAIYNYKKDCMLTLRSTDDNDWEILFNNIYLNQVKSFVSNNWKRLSLEMIEEYIKSNNYEKQRISLYEKSK